MVLKIFVNWWNTWALLAPRWFLPRCMSGQSSVTATGAWLSSGALHSCSHCPGLSTTRSPLSPPAGLSIGVRWDLRASDLHVFLDRFFLRIQFLIFSWLKCKYRLYSWCCRATPELWSPWWCSSYSSSSPCWSPCWPTPTSPTTSGALTTSEPSLSSSSCGDSPAGGGPSRCWSWWWSSSPCLGSLSTSTTSCLTGAGRPRSRSTPPHYSSSATFWPCPTSPATPSSTSG